MPRLGYGALAALSNACAMNVLGYFLAVLMRGIWKEALVVRFLHSRKKRPVELVLGAIRLQLRYELRVARVTRAYCSVGEGRKGAAIR